VAEVAVNVKWPNTVLREVTMKCWQKGWGLVAAGSICDESHSSFLTKDAMHIIFARILFITQKDQIEGRETFPCGD